MPANLDFECSECDEQVLDRVAPSGTPAPLCPKHQVPMVLLWRSRRISRLGQPVEFTDDDGTVHRFTSADEIHRFEARTEREWRAGARPRPFVFREFSQDRSNFDRNVFQSLHPQVPREKLVTRRHGRPIVSGGVIEVHETEEE